MSFDLYLRKRDNRFDETAALDWFRARPLYRVEGRQAIYGSADTGVYFVFELRRGPGDNYDLHFELNFFRPSYFVLEAEPEVTALVRAFDFIVTDPQIEGMGEDRYDGPGLIASWNRSNEITLPAFLRDPSARQNLATLPTARLHELWRWNHGRKALQDSVGDHKFVPRVSVMRIDGQARTAIVWTDGIPMVVPTVDLVVIYRKTLAPRRLLRQRPDWALLTWADASILISPHAAPHASGGLVLQYDQPSATIVNALKALRPLADKPAVLSLDSVLDREIVERALAVRE